MKLSILIPTHNRPQLLERCLYSVLRQIPEWAEVVVNNDSHDIEELPHAQVNYHYQQFDNISSNYKFLLEQARGEYVYYLEDDDYLTEDFFDKIALNADVVVGNYCPMYDVPNKLQYLKMYQNATVSPAEYKRIVNHEHLQLSQFLFKRKTIQTFNFPTDNNIHNDINLVYHALGQSTEVETLNAVLFFQTKDGGDNISFVDTAPSVPVTANMDFLNAYRKIVRCSIDGTPPLFFDWPLTEYCNHQCRYCPVIDKLTTDLKNANHTHMHNVTLARLKNVSSPFNVCVTGGEPTLHPNIDEILDGLTSIPNCLSVSMFTNLSRSISFFKRFEGTRKLVVFASYHPEFSKSDFIDKCIALSDMDVDFSVHVTLSDQQEHWGKTLELIQQLREHNITHKPLLLSPTKHYNPVYGTDFRAVFDNVLSTTGKNTAGGDFFKTLRIEYDDGTVEYCQDYDVELRGVNKFKGYACKTSSYSINMDGTITNTCTGKAVPLNMSALGTVQICPNEVCPGRRLMQFEKTYELHATATH